MSALTHAFRILRYSTAILYIMLTKIMTNAFLFVLLKGENQGQYVKSLLGHQEIQIMLALLKREIQSQGATNALRD